MESAGQAEDQHVVARLDNRVTGDEHAFFAAYEAGKRQVASYLEKLLEQWEELPPVFMTSSQDRRGREELLNYIEEMNKLPLVCAESEQD